MKINNFFEQFNGIIDVGLNCLFVDCNINGNIMENKMLVNIFKSFNNIIFYSKLDDVLQQKDDLAKIVNKLSKLNNNINIIIYTNGKIRPVAIKDYSIIKFYVTIDTKNKDNAYLRTIKWFNSNNSCMCFKINNEDELDNININYIDYGLTKRNVWLISDNNNETFFNKLVLFCNEHNYNFSFDYKKMFWNNIKFKEEDDLIETE